MSFLSKQIYMGFFENAHKQTNEIWDDRTIKNFHWMSDIIKIGQFRYNKEILMCKAVYGSTSC